MGPENWTFLRDFRALDEYEQARGWQSVGDDPVAQGLRDQFPDEIARLCRLIAEAERRIYDKRAGTLKRSHPLAIQVNLDTGVANGVLVVRTIDECARLLRGLLTNSLEFELEESQEDQMWYLKETISGCVFRVVTKDRKLTNCFWNFYPQKEG
jgi:hypothetical protein